MISFRIQNYIFYFFLLLFFFAFEQGTFVFSFEKRLETFKNFKKNKYRLFLFANQDYEGTDFDLEYTENDIEAFETIFSNIFNIPKEKIHKYINLTVEEFANVLEEEEKRIKKINEGVKKEERELIIIIYAGHGDVNGMPITVDKKTINPELYYSFINSFDNDTIVIMDSCFSGTEDSFSTSVSGEFSFNVTYQENDINEKPGITRSNVLRIYSSLSNQESREGNYRESKLLKPYFSEMYDFLDYLGYKKSGNGIFSITFLSFFSDVDFSEKEYNYQDLINYINFKFTKLYQFGLNQRSKMIPWIIPFKNKDHYKIFYTISEKEQKRKKEEHEILYIKGVQRQNDGDNRKAIYYYHLALRYVQDYKDIKNRLGDAYFKLAKEALESSEENLPVALEYAKESLYYNPDFFIVRNFIADIYLKQNNLEESLKNYNLLYEKAKRTKNIYWILNTGIKLVNLYETKNIPDKEEKIAILLEDLLKSSGESKNIQIYISILDIKARKAYEAKSFKLASKYYNQILELKKKNKYPLTGLILANLGFINLELKKHEESFNYFIKAIPLLKSQGTNEQLIFSIYLKLFDHLEKNLKDESILTLFEKVHKSFQDNNRQVKLELIESFLKLNEYKLFIQFLEKYIEIELLFYLETKGDIPSFLKDFFNPIIKKSIKASKFFLTAELSRLMGIFLVENKYYLLGLKNLNSAKSFIEKDKSLEIAVKDLFIDNVKDLLYNSYNLYTKYLIEKAFYKEFLEISKEMETFYLTYKDKEYLPYFYFNLSYVFLNLNLFQKAFSQVTIAIHFTQKKEDRALFLKLFLRIGFKMIEVAEKDEKKQLYYLKQIYEVIKDNSEEYDYEFYKILESRLFLYLKSKKETLFKQDYEQFKKRWPVINIQGEIDFNSLSKHVEFYNRTIPIIIQEDNQDQAKYIFIADDFLSLIQKFQEKLKSMLEQKDLEFDFIQSSKVFNINLVQLSMKLGDFFYKKNLYKKALSYYSPLLFLAEEKEFNHQFFIKQYRNIFSILKENKEQNKLETYSQLEGFKQLKFFQGKD